MKDLKSIKALVQSLLEQDERTRNSDSYLYFRVINTMANRDNLDLTKISVTAFLLNMNELGCPPFESVRRTRQKVQRECPWLASCEKVNELRSENEVAYREFARG